MRNMLFFFALTVFGCASPTKPIAKQDSPAAPSEFDLLIHQAEAEGLQLFEAYKSKKFVNEDLLTIAKTAITDFCQFNYQTLTIDGQGRVAVYFIGQTNNNNDLVWGRHYKVEIDTTSMSAVSVTPSTKSCFAMQSNPNVGGGKVVGAMTTHLLGDTPTAFHVFLNHKTGQTIGIGTKAGTWMIEGGKIRKL